MPETREKLRPDFALTGTCNERDGWAMLWAAGSFNATEYQGFDPLMLYMAAADVDLATGRYRVEFAHARRFARPEDFPEAEFNELPPGEWSKVSNLN